jgi:hypothetical protein
MLELWRFGTLTFSTTITNYYRNMVSEQRSSEKRKRSSRKEGLESTNASAPIKGENEITATPDPKQTKNGESKDDDRGEPGNANGSALPAATDQDKKSSRFIVFVGASSLWAISVLHD